MPRRSVIQRKDTVGKAVGGIYVTAAIFPLLWGAAVLTLQPGAGVLIGVAGLFLSPLFASLTLPLSLPLAIACCWILRKLDPWRSGTYGPVTLDLHKAGARPWSD